MRLKTISLQENGDFDVTVSFSKEDIQELGINTTFHMDHSKNILEVIWNDLKKEIREDDRRTWHR